MEQIKEWQTHSFKNRVAALLMLDGVSFRYSESDGIVFTAPAEYVAKMKRQLTTCYGCRVEPIVNEYKKLLC